MNNVDDAGNNVHLLVQLGGQVTPGGVQFGTFRVDNWQLQEADWELAHRAVTVFQEKHGQVDVHAGNLTSAIARCQELRTWAGNQFMAAFPRLPRTSIDALKWRL